MSRELMHRHIDDIVETLRTAKQRGVGTVLLTGAGCSVSAGIPTAVGFVDLIRERYPRSYDRAVHKQYPYCMAQLSISERRDLIVQYIKASKINWAHVGIAQLMLHGFVDRVLTTNFDPLVMRACALVDIFPAIYDFAASQFYKPADIPGHSIFHLHGQHTGFVLLNTEEQCTRHAAHLAPVFEDAGRGRVWLVVGYSGENDPVFEHLARVEQFDNKLYWIGYNNNEPQRHVRERLLSGNKDAFYVNGFDADEFFVTLAQRLDCFPPDIIARPFSHLDKRIQQLAPFRMPSQALSSDVVHVTRQLIRQAKYLFEERPSSNEPADRNVMSVADAPRVLKAMGHLMAGQHDEIIAMRPHKGQPFPHGLRVSVCLSYCAKGDLALMLASGQHGAVKEKSISDALDYFKRAADVPGQFWPAYRGWGRSLTTRALHRIGHQAAEDLENGIKKLEEAIKRNADKGLIYQDIIGALLSYLNVEAELADGILDRAERYLEKALADAPELAEIRLFRANICLERGKRQSDARGKALLKQAYDEYVASASSGPAMASMWHNAGNALTALAQHYSGEEADSLFQQALDHYQQTSLPEGQAALTGNSVGCLYFAWGQRSTGESQRKRFEKAAQYLENVLDAQPDFFQALANLLALQRLRAPLLPKEDAAALFQEVLRRIDAAVQRNPQAPTAALLRADAAVELARWVPPAEGDALRAQARELYKEMAKRYPDRPRLGEALGVLFVGQAVNSVGAESDNALREAVTWYAREHKLRPQEPTVAHAYADALKQLSMRVKGKEQERFLSQAIDALRSVANGAPQPLMLTLLASLLSRLASLKSKKSAVILLREADQHLSFAASQSPDSSELLFEWGFVLSKQAEHADNKEAPAILDQAVAKLREALTCSPHPNHVWCHALLGSVLLGRARRSANRGSEEYLQEAIVHLKKAPANLAVVSAMLAEAFHKLAKLQTALARPGLLEQAANYAAAAAVLSPNVVEYAENHGVVLLDRADLLSAEIRRPVLLAAESEYARACAMAPTRISAQVGRARSLTELAVVAYGDEAQRLWRQSEEIFSALDVNHPEALESFGRWGNARLRRAEVLETENDWLAAEQVFRQAALLGSKAGNKCAWPHFGIAAALAGRAILTEDAVAACLLATQAKLEVVAVLQDDPRDPNVLSILATVAILLAHHGDRAAKKGLLEEVREQFTAAGDAAHTHRLLNQWGQILTELAMVADEDQRDHFFMEAIGKFEEAIQQSYVRHLELLNQATVWISWAMTGEPADAAIRLGRVEQLVNESQAIHPTIGARAMRIELDALRAVLGCPETDETKLDAAVSELSTLLTEETNSAIAYISAARLHYFLARYSTDKDTQTHYLYTAAQYMAAAERLAPGCTRGRNSIDQTEAVGRVQVESAETQMHQGPADLLGHIPIEEAE